ncbi:hypothetical protein Gohar_021591 [Gossypium harknessii]|uniref:RRM domain-containing protein n=1 Tax=Gossypium harknessii TaxID=34285 RepID=A0A7J9IAI3_9ROSI|nr:hypothetical protein [Gossypium harknessii]
MKPHVTLLVYNIPMTMHWKGLWTLFRYHGDVIDAFIPAKKSKSGRKLGFVRFDKIMDAQKVINREQDIDDEQLWKLQKCLVGETATFCETKSLTEKLFELDWNYTSFKRIVGLWGELVPLGENMTKMNSFDKMAMLVSIKQTERIGELIFLDVGEENDDEIVSESRLATRTGLQKTSEERQIGDDEAINVIFLEKENDNDGCQRTWENEPNWGVE